MAESENPSIIRFWDESERPPQGGWRYGDAHGYSADDVFQAVKRQRMNNAKFVSDEALWRELWSHWCAREPARCGQAVSAVRTEVLRPRELTKDFFGPIIWRAMNLHAVRFEQVGRENFMRFLGTVSTLMDCMECISHWQGILSSRPPWNIRTTLEACQWVNTVHNEVNQRRGAAIYPYAQMVAEYGAPLP